METTTPGEGQTNNPADENEQNPPTETKPDVSGSTLTPEAPPETSTADTPAPETPVPDDVPTPEPTAEEQALEARTEARAKQLHDLGFEQHPDSPDIAHLPNTDFSIDKTFVETADDDAWGIFINNFTSAKETKEETPVDEDAPKPFDYAGKIRLSDQDHDAVDIKKAKKLIKQSGVPDHHKDVLLQQIKNGRLAADYAQMLRMIISADSQGSIYSGTL